MKSSSSARILVADDSPDSLYSLVALLQTNGYQVSSASGGNQALELARSAPPDLILLDMHMPDLDGIDVCRRCKQEPHLQGIPVIFISAIAETEDKLAAFQVGGVDYVTKPYHPSEVIARVSTHLKIQFQQAELRNNWEQLQKLEQLRDSLTHMIVHDMRAPLMTVEGNLKLVDMFEGDRLTYEGKTYVADARNGVARLSKMVLEMLTVSRLESGKLEPKLEPCELVELGRKMVFWADAFFSNKKIQFTSSVRKVTVPADLDLIIRVLENLVSNAVKFASEAGKVHLRLIVEKEEVRLEVEDDGPGISEQETPKLFEKFSQITGPHQRKGTGLGLAFCKLAIQAHGGRIGVNSQPGKGSIFWFVLKRNPSFHNSIINQQ